MRRHVLWVSLFVLALSGGAASGAWPQALELALRGPRFIAAWKPAGEAVDVSNAVVLRRRVSLDLTNVTADEALKEITRQGGLEITYSSSLLPRDKSVSVHAREITVAAALTEVLLDAGLDVAVGRGGTLALVKRKSVEVESDVADSGAVIGRVTDERTGSPVAGATIVLDGTQHSATTEVDGRFRLTGVPAGSYRAQARYIGFAPLAVVVTVVEGQETVLDFRLERSAQLLDQVVVTGTVVPTEVKALPTPISVVTSEDIEQQNLTRVDQIFRGTVPGAIAWEQGVGDYYSTIQVRGRNSLYATPSVKTYIDGIEVNDPITIATIDPNSIERIEVTRGPQGSTIYGSNASGGVMQIFTKKGFKSSRPQLSGKVALGAIQSPVSDGLGVPVRQDYALTLAGGGDNLSYNIGGSYLGMGEWVPGYYSRTPGLYAGAELSQGPVTVDLTARYTVKSYANVYSPTLDQLPFFSQPSYEANRLEQQTYGIDLSYRVSPRWQHRLLLGLDRQATNTHNTQPRLTSPADTFLSLNVSNNSKTSVRYHTSYEVPVAPALSSVVTAGLEYYEVDGTADFTGDATRTIGSIDGTHFLSRTRFDNTGFFGQLQVGIHDALFVTGGIRGERNENFGSDVGTAWSPRVGASYVRPIGDLSVKLRASYGNAINAVAPGRKAALRDLGNDQLANPLLGPERQKGWDAGVELYAGTAASVGVTFYDQTADDLIDLVLIDPSVVPAVTQFQNVGQIKNRGWEFEGRIVLGQLGVAGTYSRTTSTVRRLGPTYGGDLQVGDRLLDTPANTSGLQIGYEFARGTSVAAAMTYIGQWTGTNWLALYDVFFGGAEYTGSGRDYWTQYPAVTKFNLSLSQRVTTQLTGFMQIDNVGNSHRFEQSNVSDPLGRVTTIGLRFQY